MFSPPLYHDAGRDEYGCPWSLHDREVDGVAPCWRRVRRLSLSGCLQRGSFRGCVRRFCFRDCGDPMEATSIWLGLHLRWSVVGAVRAHVGPPRWPFVGVVGLVILAKAVGIVSGSTASSSCHNICRAGRRCSLSRRNPRFPSSEPSVTLSRSRTRPRWRHDPNLLQYRRRGVSWP